MDEAAVFDFAAEIVRRMEGEPGPRPARQMGRRRVVERSFAWMTRWRRLVRDFETRIDVSEAMTHVALPSTLPPRVAHP